MRNRVLCTRLYEFLQDHLRRHRLEIPNVEGHDLLVNICAVWVNPVDTTLRVRQEPDAGGWGILGYNAAGVVDAVGPEVQYFKPGEAIFYAGAID